MSGYACVSYQNSLSSIDQTSEETQNIERALSIKTGSWLIQKQQRRLCDKFDTKGNTFPLLNTETSTGHYVHVSILVHSFVNPSRLTSNQSVADVPQFQKVNNVVNISNLLFIWHSRWLAKSG